MSSWLTTYLSGGDLTALPVPALSHSLEHTMLTTGDVALITYLMPFMQQAVHDITIEQVTQFVATLIELTAQELSCQTLSHKTGLPPKTILRLLIAVERAGIWFRLSCFDRADNGVNNRSKGYIKSTAQSCAYLGLTNAEQLRGHRQWGALFEAYIVNAIAQQIDALEGQTVTLNYWRTTHGSAEVDLIIKANNTIYPIEIKSAVRATTHNAAKIAVLRQRYKDAVTVSRGLVVYAGEQCHQMDEMTLAIPWSYLLRGN